MELVDNNRPHFKPPTNTTNNELFICFTSRLSSSSSMKIAKSILSPGRAARDPPVSLSTSLSRRLRSNGSVKSGGMASPMFPKKKGPGFENPEPSSPKVTCIGQVRVKTKKKVKQQTRSLSRRRSGEVSFRKVGEIQSGEKLGSPPAGSVHNNPSLQTQIQHQECMNGRNQKWVHFPGTFCEALSCLFPCRSSCFSSEKGNKEEASEIDNNGGSTSSSCGAVFTRWFVSVHDCEGGKGREIELVVGGGDDEEEDGKAEVRQRISMRSSRRHVFEDMEFNEEMMADVKDEEEVEKARVSICVPPKNALLLMRCRSDPMKMADLTNRFWESPAPLEDEDEEHDERAVQVAEVSENVDAEVFAEVEAANNGEETAEMDKDVNLSESVAEMEEIVGDEVEEKGDEDEEMQESEEAESNIDAFEDLLGEDTAESSVQWQIEQEEEVEQAVEEEEEDEEETSPELLYSTSFLYRDCETWEMLQGDDENEEGEEKSATEVEDDEEEETPETASFEEDPTEAVAEGKEEEAAAAAEENGFEEVEEKRTSTSSNVLPDCLLMMMCEPKLSMEVSKETWVCSTDFVRWLPERPPKKKVHAPPEEAVVPKKAANLHPLPPLPAAAPRQQKVQPGRSSCTLPAAAAVSMAAMIEQKLVNAVGYEPFVLTRCKSEPMRTAAAKLLPEACCWKNRKLEPHRNATFGVGAAGVGF